MSAPSPPYTDWLSNAANDLLNIENNMVATQFPWDTICFHAQQAAEKWLKAFLVLHGQTPRRTHDLVALLAECAAIDAGLMPLEHDCRQLTYYAIASRYPDALYEPGEADGRVMVTALHRVRADLLPRFPAPPSP